MRNSLYGSIESHIRKFANQLYTCTPAIVDSYNPDDCTVNVYPAIYKPDKDGIDTREGYLERIPLHFQATQELGITFPVRKGDTVLLVFGMYDSEKWLTSNRDYDYANTRRTHNVNDAYAIAGVFKYNSSPVQSGTENDLNIRYKDSYIRIQENGDISLKNNTKVTVDSPDTFFTGNIQVSGSTTLSDTVTSNGKDISDTHTHGGVQTGGGNTSVPN